MDFHSLYRHGNDLVNNWSPFAFSPAEVCLISGDFVLMRWALKNFYRRKQSLQLTQCNTIASHHLLIWRPLRLLVEKFWCMLKLNAFYCIHDKLRIYETVQVAHCAIQPGDMTWLMFIAYMIQKMMISRHTPDKQKTSRSRINSKYFNFFHPLWMTVIWNLLSPVKFLRDSHISAALLYFFSVWWLTIWLPVAPTYSSCDALLMWDEPCRLVIG